MYFLVYLLQIIGDTSFAAAWENFPTFVSHNIAFDPILFTLFQYKKKLLGTVHLLFNRVVSKTLRTFSSMKIP
jgi:hypothetical protein